MALHVGRGGHQCAQDDRAHRVGQAADVELGHESHGQQFVLVDEMQRQIAHFPPGHHHFHTGIGDRFDLLQEKTWTFTEKKKAKFFGVWKFEIYKEW